MGPSCQRGLILKDCCTLLLASSLVEESLPVSLVQCAHGCGPLFELVSVTNFPLAEVILIEMFNNVDSEVAVDLLVGLSQTLHAAFKLGDQLVISQLV